MLTDILNWAEPKGFEHAGTSCNTSI
jgi:hypothetical protein